MSRVNLVAAQMLSPELKAVIFDPPWTRLEPQSVSGDPTPGIEARVHDPLWLLARQWQLGEFQGEDAGSPLLVNVKARSIPVTAWQSGDLDTAKPAELVPDGIPLDPLVEQEPTPEPRLGLRQRAEAGAYLVELLADAGLDVRDALVAACPLDVDEILPDPAIPPEQNALPAVFPIIASIAPDGLRAAAQLESGDPVDWLDGALPGAIDAADRWLAWFRANVLPPADRNDSWIPDRLEYRFSIRAGSGDSQLVFAAPVHEGGDIDWFTFDQVPRARLTLENEPDAVPAEELSLTMLASPLRFDAMPSRRYWQFENGRVNLAALDSQPHDLSRLCVTEFAMVYSDDWIVVPLTIRAGSFVTITSVEYTTTFGETIRVAPPDDRNRVGRFSMFNVSVSGQDGATIPGMLVPPSARATIEGKALEEVLFLRDEMANMAWAVERSVQARSGDPRSRGDELRPDNSVHDLKAGAELQYLLQTEVPRHWIPMVPIATGIGAIALRKGTMADEDLSLGLLLEPTPLTIRDEEIPREGLRLRRVPALARRADGTYVRWMTRRASPGRGEGASGLAFDGAYRP
jgi:hypothetical protein